MLSPLFVVLIKIDVRDFKFTLLKLNHDDIGWDFNVGHRNLSTLGSLYCTNIYMLELDPIVHGNQSGPH